MECRNPAHFLKYTYPIPHAWNGSRKKQEGKSERLRITRNRNWIPCCIRIPVCTGKNSLPRPIPSSCRPWKKKSRFSGIRNFVSVLVFHRMELSGCRFSLQKFPASRTATRRSIGKRSSVSSPRTHRSSGRFPKCQMIQPDVRRSPSPLF